MAISVTIGGPQIEGIELMSPTDPAFDATVRSIFRGNCDELLKLKPFLTIVSNHSDRTLVAYSTKWEIADRAINTALHKYPDAVAPVGPQRGNEIRAGEQNIIAMGIELDTGRWGGQATEDFYLSQFISWFSKDKDAKALEISIDSVIFDDGALVGPDNFQLARFFMGEVNANQAWYKIIVDRMDAGMSFDDAFAPVQEVVTAAAASPQLWQDMAKRANRVAATEVVRWRRKYGDEAAPEIYRRLLRTEPFIIRGGVNIEIAKDEQIPSNVACPRCHCLPRSTDRWYCTCGNLWNTFSTRALCPICNHQWKETVCPACGEMSPHEDWYVSQ